MDNVFFETPPALQGDGQAQLRQLYGYLYAMSEKLNAAMIEVDVQAKQEIQRTATGQAAQQAENFGTLKSMIIKTAEIVRTEMQEISTQLHGETEAISADLGALEQTMDATIRATAEGILQDYHFEELVTDTNTNTFYRTQTNQYIFTGKISDDPVTYGIAIGEGVTAYDQDGNPYLNQNAKVATFSMDTLAFWQGTVQLAYFSSGKFYITNGEITNTLQIGNYVFKKMADDSMVLVRI